MKNKGRKKGFSLICHLALAVSLVLPAVAGGLPLDVAGASDQGEEKGPASFYETVLSDDVPLVELNKKDVHRQETDALTETYIRRHADPAYVSFQEARLVDALYAKQGIFDGAAMQAGDRPEEILHDLEFGDDEASDAAARKYLGHMSSLVAVYDVDEESDYYVALADTLKDTEGLRALDWTFAKANDYAQTYDNWIYDAKTGLAYLPKTLFDPACILSNQIQIMYAADDYLHATTDIDAVCAGTDIETFTTTSSLFDQETVVQISEDMDPSALSVAVNGVPLDGESWDYEPETGQMRLSVAPASCQTVSVRDEEKPLARAIKAAFRPLAANALTYSGLGYYKSNVVTLTAAEAEKIKKGLFFTGTAQMSYYEKEPYNQIHTGTEIDPDNSSSTTYGYQDVEALVRAIKENRVSEGNISLRTYAAGMFDFALDLTKNSLRAGTVSGDWLSGYGRFTLECSHTNSPVGNANGAKSYSGDNPKWTMQKVGVRILDIDTTKQYVVVAMVGAKMFGQTPANIFKLHLKVDAAPDEGVASYEKRAEYANDVDIKIRKKDQGTGELLAGAGYRVFLDGSRQADMTTGGDGMAVYHAQKAYAVSKTFRAKGDYRWIENYSDLTKADQKKYKNYPYKGKGAGKAAQAAAKKEVTEAIKVWKNTQKNKDHSWTVQEIKAPERHTLSAAPKQVKKAAAKTDTLSFTFQNQVPTGKIRVIKKIEGTPVHPELTPEGAQYGIYAADPIYDTDNKSVLYAKDKLVQTVTILDQDGEYAGEADGLLPGNYYVKETLAPPGYLLDPQVYAAKITVTEAMQTIAASAANTVTITSMEEETQDIPDSEKIMIRKTKTGPGKTEAEENAAFFVFDIHKAASLDPDPLYGSCPYTDFLNRADREDSRERSRQGLAAYLQEKGCAIGTMTTDASGSAVLLLPQDAYEKGDSQASDVGYGFAILQTAGEMGYSWQPLLLKDQADRGTQEDSLTASQRKEAHCTVYSYEMDDVLTDFGYLSVYKYMTDGVDEETGRVGQKAEEGAVFEIFNAQTGQRMEGEGRSTLTTDESGYAKSFALPYGTYILRQVSQSVKGHQMSPDQIFTIGKESGQEGLSLQLLNNEDKPDLYLIKEADGEEMDTGGSHRLNDAVFLVQIWDQDKGWQTLSQMVTGTEERGCARMELPGYGKYRLLEKAAPEGYQTCQAEAFIVDAETVSYDEEGQAYLKVTRKDEPVWGHVTLTKHGELLTGVSRENNVGFVFEDGLLAGAQYGLYAAEDIVSPDGVVTHHKKDALVADGTTDDSGSIRFMRTLPDGSQTDQFYLGSYYIREIKAPPITDPAVYAARESRYTLDAEKHMFNLPFVASETAEISISEADLDQSLACAVLQDDGSLLFFRADADLFVDSDAGDWEEEAGVDDGLAEARNGQAGSWEDIYGNQYTGRLFTGIETLSAQGAEQVPWHAYAGQISSVGIADHQVIRPLATAFWFAGCSALQTCDLTFLDTSMVSNMASMFEGCRRMERLVSQMQTSGVENMSGMFGGCSALLWLDASGWETGRVSAANGMFAGCTALQAVYVSGTWTLTGTGAHTVLID